ncbi:ketoacyl-ACP synthase III family protein [Streptomyces sp. NPDC055210]
MRVENVYIAGLGTYLPERVKTADAVAKGWYSAEDNEAAKLLSVAVAGSTPAPDMAVDAARLALEQAGHEPDEFSALLHSNTHPQGPEGWSAQHYILRRTLNRGITALEVRLGCLGLLASMQLGSCFLTAVPERTAVLLTSADNVGTPILDRWRTSTLYVLADGGAAMVLSKRSGFARILAVGSYSNPEMEELHRGGEEMFPPSITVGKPLDFEARRQYWRKKWAEGETPPQGDLSAVVVEAAERTLAESGVTMDDIAKVVHVSLAYGPLHDLFLDPLGVEEARCIWEFSRSTGHGGSVDHVAGLEHVWRTGQVGPGDRVLLIGATPGAEAACAVVEIERAP